VSGDEDPPGQWHDRGRVNDRGAEHARDQSSPALKVSMPAAACRRVGPHPHDAQAPVAITETVSSALVVAWAAMASPSRRRP
jgi:hypothetical protein